VASRVLHLHFLYSLKYLVNSKITHMRALFAVVALPRILALPQANGIYRARAFAGRIVVLFIAGRGRFVPIIIIPDFRLDDLINQLRIVNLNRTGQAFSDAQFFCP
jgi:hypothetical protein